MELVPTILEGCFKIHPFFTEDERGTFVKTFNAERFAEFGLQTEWREEYYSSSRKGVIRGMHFQTPPYDHEKLVYCLSGKVLDVILDLRSASRTYGRYISIALDANKGHGMFIPKGMAHGFLALTENVLMAYKVATTYAPQNDAGIRWDSFGCDWGVNNPIISTRDNKHPFLEDFISPF